MKNVNLPHRCIVDGVDRGAHDFERTTVTNGDDHNGDLLTIMTGFGKPASIAIRCKNCGVALGDALFEMGKLIEEKIS